MFNSTEFAVHPTDGYVYKVSRRGELVDGAWKVAVSATRLKSGFGSTRILAYGYPYLYRVTGSALYRYTVDPATGVPSAAVRLASTGWGTVNTLVYERTGGTGAGTVDVLIGTDSGGQLKEWKINHATPTQITAKVLQIDRLGAVHESQHRLLRGPPRRSPAARDHRDREGVGALRRQQDRRPRHRHQGRFPRRARLDRARLRPIDGDPSHA